MRKQPPARKIVAAQPSERTTRRRTISLDERVDVVLRRRAFEADRHISGIIQEMLVRDIRDNPSPLDTTHTRRLFRELGD